VRKHGLKKSARQEIIAMEKEIRSENIKVRLTPSERKKVEEILQEYEIKNISEFIREIILSGSFKIEKGECEQSQSNLLYELNKIGVNINQIAKYANIEKEIDVKVLKELQKINEQLSILI